MQHETTKYFGNASQLDVSTLIEKLTGMTDIIEANFSQIKEILEKHKDEMIKVITQKNEKEIINLKQELKAKDIQINNLKQKEGQLQVKDDIIPQMTANIDILQQQLALASHGSSHEKVELNPL